MIFFFLIQTEVKKFELVKNMGVMINPGILASAIRKSKRQPTRLMRLLMANLFTQEELQTST